MMKPTQSLFKMFLLPILMVVMPALSLMAIAMEIKIKQTLNNFDTIIQVAMMLLGIGMMGGLIGVAFFFVWRSNKRLMIIGDAILLLSKRELALPDLQAVEKLSQQSRGSLLRVSKALITLQQSEGHRRAAEDKVHQLAYYDPLTQLPNCRLLRERLQRSLDTSQQTSNYGALIYLDVDDFNRVNDSSGHRVGDNLLQQIAQRLSNLESKSTTIGRMGGDEFMVIIDGLASEPVKAGEEVQAFAKQLQQILNTCYQVGDKKHFLSVSLGIALFNGSEETIDNLFQYSNAAVHLAKHSSPSGLRFYDPKARAELEADTELSHDLRLAIEHQEFVLVYQSQVDTLGRTIGAEALIRWEHPRLGIVSPGAFIPIAEKTGLILPIGNWVLETACKQLVSWAKDKHTRHLTLSVNVSAKQFQQPDFVDIVSNALAKSGASANRLKLELTESTMIGKIEDIIARMHQLKALGISFSLDDFGTGYSSLQYLKRLPLDQIKIDQSFVRHLHENTDDKAIVQTIIAMGNSLGLNVIAEGVETQEHWRYLSEHQYHAFQGYYFCKPVSAAEMVRNSLTPLSKLA